MITRRKFFKYSTAAGALLLVRPQSGEAHVSNLVGSPARHYQIPGGTLDPGSVAKFAEPLTVPPAMPRTAKLRVTGGKNIDYYEIAVRQFQQQILPSGMPMTTVWSYGSLASPGTVVEGGSFNYPAFTIEARWEAPVRVKWINDLVDASGNYLHHLLPVDPTLHWANPPGGETGRDKRPEFDDTPGPYTGPVPVVTHVHGAHTTQESDGYPEAWYLPDANNIPDGYAKTGTFYDLFKDSSPLGESWTPGTAVFEYPNDQRATTLWYHDHSLGITRVNVYAGPAGFYLLRGGPDDTVLDSRNNRPAMLPGPAPQLGDAPGMAYYEIPIVIQDRSFNADGSLFYPDTRTFFDGFPGPFVPDTPISPIWNPEFFGNMMVVNGRTWPHLEVEQRRYRFRFLNGCDSRFLILELEGGLPFWQIGAEGGFLPAPVQLNRLLVGPAERADVIVDFGSVPAGTNITLRNLGPDEPFGGGEPGDDFDVSDPASTGQVMQFRVITTRGADRTTPPERLVLPAIIPLGLAEQTRQLSLNEEAYELNSFEGPSAALLGTVNSGVPLPLLWSDAVTENPMVGATEVWEIFNFTADAHPIHVHLVQFQVVNRQALETEDDEVIIPAETEDEPQPPEAWETGYKDTVIAYPGQVTRIKARFDVAGLFVWHCHILEHEDNEMMRPYRVGDA